MIEPRNHVLDLWVLSWRKKQASGEMYVVRYADDFVMAFQKEQDARAMHRALAQRLADFGLKLHPQKTRVIEFGRFARESRAGRGLAKPETFDFLGFTHIAGKGRDGRGVRGDRGLHIGRGGGGPHLAGWVGSFCDVDSKVCTASYPNGAVCKDAYDCQSEFCAFAADGSGGTCIAHAVNEEACATGLL